MVYQEASGHYTNIKQFTWQILDENDEWVVVYTSPEFDEFWIDFEDDFEEPVTCMAIGFTARLNRQLRAYILNREKCAMSLVKLNFIR